MAWVMNQHSLPVSLQKSTLEYKKKHKQRCVQPICKYSLSQHRFVACHPGVGFLHQTTALDVITYFEFKQNPIL